MNKIILLPVKGENPIAFKSVEECLEKTHLSRRKFYDALNFGLPIFLKIDGFDEKKAFYVDEAI